MEKYVRKLYGFSIEEMEEIYCDGKSTYHIDEADIPFLIFVMSVVVCASKI